MPPRPGLLYALLALAALPAVYANDDDDEDRDDRSGSGGGGKSSGAGIFFLLAMAAIVSITLYAWMGLTLWRGCAHKRPNRRRARAEPPVVDGTLPVTEAAGEAAAVNDRIPVATANVVDEHARRGDDVIEVHPSAVVIVEDSPKTPDRRL
ncbi:hypothetical protein M885DRAFT_561711 [Pelagophyceae sp. CCMP2097]|nr:hypothetical protein M885DRAFT_561711 [Pelagophyceae sp. CCMP2097]